MIKKNFNYSPNFDLQKRHNHQIKFLIFHYTGMRSESEAINRLTNTQSRVSSHYLIKRNGEIIVLVPDLYVAWHAGKSYWKRFKFLNKSSIGIEISNPGHSFNYKKFSSKQIRSIVKLSKYLIKKYKIKKSNILGHSDIAYERKKDPGEKFPWSNLASKNIGIWKKISKEQSKKLRKQKITKKESIKYFKYLKKIGYFVKIIKKQNSSKLVKSFQRRFRQDLIDGIIDKECLNISINLVKNLNNFS